MAAWDNAGLPIEKLPQLSVQEVRQTAEPLAILDVRTPGEWKSGHIPKAEHFFLPRLLKETPQISKEQAIAVYCASGYRASLAASLLQARGFKKVHNIPGSWQAWHHAGYPAAQEPPQAEALRRAA
jgi:hydroxyacylglutathione hydrolase